MALLDNTKVGDDVALCTRAQREKRTVISATKTSLKLNDGTRWMRGSGREYGTGGRAWGSWIKPWDEAEYQALLAERRLIELRHTVRALPFHDLTTEQLQRIIAIANEPTEPN